MPDPLILVDLRTGAGSARPRAERGQPASVADNRFPCFDFSAEPASGGGNSTAEAEPIYSASDLKAAVEEARRSTAIEVEDRIREALLKDLDHRQAEALAAIAARLRDSQERMDTWSAQWGAISHRLALMLARSIVPKALERQPLADIGDMLRRTIARLADQPTIELRLHPDLVEAGGELLGQVVEATGYRGSVSTLADATLGPGDARLVWKGGAAERDVAALADEVAALVDIWLPAADVPSAGQDPPPGDAEQAAAPEGASTLESPSIEDRSMP